MTACQTSPSCSTDMTQVVVMSTRNDFHESTVRHGCTRVMSSPVSNSRNCSVHAILLYCPESLINSWKSLTHKSCPSQIHQALTTWHMGSLCHCTTCRILERPPLVLISGRMPSCPDKEGSPRTNFTIDAILIEKRNQGPSGV